MTVLALFGHLLPSSTDLHLEDLTIDDFQQLTVTATAIEQTARCPRCHQPTARVHTRYSRTVADLPWADVAVLLQLRVPKFVCTTPDCPPPIFTERLPAVLAPWARRTTRLADHPRQIGLALGAPCWRSPGCGPRSRGRPQHPAPPAADEPIRRGAHAAHPE